MASHRILDYIKNPVELLITVGHYGLLNWLSDEKYIRLLWMIRMKTKLDLDNPKTFNEKIQWLKLHYKNPMLTSLCDKVTVRSFIKATIGDKYLVPLIGVFNCTGDIHFDTLPRKFVLKCTHDSGSYVICNDKNHFNFKKAQSKLNRGLRRNFYYVGREWPYRQIVPRIICEEFIGSPDGSPPKDYKFFCFQGVPMALYVASDRGNDTKFDYFDMNWNRLPIRQRYPNSRGIIEKPKLFDEMVECARKLSVGFPHVRVDFYVDDNDNIYVGELTFFHFSGVVPFEPEEYDYEWGSWLDISSL